MRNRNHDKRSASHEGMQALVSEIAALFAANENKKVLRLVTSSAEKGLWQSGETALEIRLCYYAGFAAMRLKDWSATASHLTQALARVEKATWEEMNEVSAHTVSLIYGGMTASTLKLDVSLDDCLLVLDAAEARLRRHGQGMDDLLLWLDHLRTKACEERSDYARALPLAEEALAAKRLNLYGRGCAVTCYLSTYTLALAGTGQLDLALSQCEIAHEEFPDYIYFGLRLASVLWDRGEPENALQKLREIASTHPHNAYVYFDLALMTGMNGDWAGACKSLRRAKRLDDTNADTHWWLAALNGTPIPKKLQLFPAWKGELALYLNGERDEVELQNALTQQRPPIRALSFALMGTRAEKRGDSIAAQEFYEQCLQLNLCFNDAARWATARLASLALETSVSSS